MEMPTINENAAYILKNSPAFRFREVDEDTFAQTARRQILTPRGADGRFLTDSPVDFFLTTGGAGKALMRPGSVKRDGYTSRGKFGKSRPVIVMEEEYPGLPIEAVADIVEGHARILHRLGKEKNREGPALSRLVQYPASLVSVVNDGLEDDARDRIEKMLEMHSTYRYRVLSWLKRKFRGPKVGFDINKGRMAGHAISSSQTTGYLLPLQEDSSVAIIEIDATRNIRRPEVAIALDFQADLNEKGFQTLLCSASLRRMLLYVTGPNIKEFLATTREGPTVLPGSGLEHQVKATLKPTKLPVLSPLSLYIPLPPPKTSSKTMGMFSHDFTGYGYAIAPIHNEDFDPFYDAHPLVVAYNIGKHTRIVSAFLRSAGLTKAIEDPHIITVEDDSLLQAFLNHRSRTQTFVETLPMEAPQITYSLPYGKEVIVKASASGSEMAGFTDGSIRAGMVQLKEIEALMPEGETFLLYGRLAAFPTLDPETPKKLLAFESSEWEDVMFHIEGIVGDKNPKKDLARISFLLGDHIMPVRHARGDVLLKLFEDEIVNGSARMLGFIHEGKRSYFLKTQRVAATVLALHTTNKRFKNGEVGTVLLGVMSEEKRPVVYTDNKGEVVKTGRRNTTIYNSIGKVGTMRGFTVEDRRALFNHLVKYGTHTEGEWLFVDPVNSDTILDVEFSNLKIAQAERFARDVQMVRNEERFATDAMKGVMMTGLFKDTDKRDVKPVLSVAQGAHKAGTRRPDYVLSDYARLANIDAAVLPQVVDARIVGIRSKIEGLAYKVVAGTALTEKTMYETDEGLVFSTDINLDQFKLNGPEPHIEGNIPSGVEALLTASLNPKGSDAKFSSHRQIEPWRFKVDDGASRLRTFVMSVPTDKRKVEHFIGWSKRFEGYEGAQVIAGPLREDVKNWAVASVRIPKKYGLRRTANEIRLDSIEAPVWYQKAHPRYKKPDPKDIKRAAQPIHRAWTEPKSDARAIAAKRGISDD